MSGWSKLTWKGFGGFHFWGFGALLIVLLVAPGTDTLQKPSNTHANLLDRAEWAAMNTEQGFDKFTLPVLEKVNSDVLI